MNEFYKKLARLFAEECGIFYYDVIGTKVIWADANSHHVLDLVTMIEETPQMELREV